MYGEDEVLIAGGFDEFASVNTTEFINLFKLKHAVVAEPHFQESSNPGLEQEIPLHAADLGRAFAVPGPEMMERRAACAVVELPPHKEKKGPSKVWIIGGTNEQGQRLQTSEWIEVFSPEQDEEDLPDAARRLSRRMSRSDAAAAAVAARAPHDDHSATDSASATAEETLTAAGSSAAGPTPDAAAEAVETAAQAAAVVLGGSADAAEGTDTAVEAETEGDPAAGDAEKQEAEPEGEDAEGEAPVEPAKVPHPNQEETPNLRQFKNGPPMLVPRSGLAAVRLSDVVVLLAGGVGPGGGHLDSTEFFDFDDSKEIMQKGPRLSWGCDSQFGFGYCAAGRTVIEPLES